MVGTNDGDPKHWTCIGYKSGVKYEQIYKSDEERHATDSLRHRDICLRLKAYA